MLFFDIGAYYQEGHRIIESGASAAAIEGDWCAKWGGAGATFTDRRNLASAMRGSKFVSGALRSSYIGLFLGASKWARGRMLRFPSGGRPGVRFIGFRLVHFLCSSGLCALSTSSTSDL